MTLEALYLRAWIAGLQERNDAPAVRAVEHPTGHVLLTDTPADRYVRLRPADKPQR